MPVGQSGPSSGPMPARLPPPYNPYGNPPSHYYNPPPSNPSTSPLTQTTTTLPWATLLPIHLTGVLLAPIRADTLPASLQGHPVLPPRSPTAIPATLRRRGTLLEGNRRATAEADRDKGTQGAGGRPLQGRATQAASPLRANTLQSILLRGSTAIRTTSTTSAATLRNDLQTNH